MMLRLLLACLALPALAAEVARPVFVEAEVDRDAPWVQSQVTYTLRAWQGSDLRELSIHGPQARLAEVRTLGPVTVREAERGGRRYRVHEQRFAVLAFASGNLELDGAHLAGRPPGATQSIRVDAPPITLRVRAAPAAAAAGWLPATKVLLTETWPAATAPATRDTAILRRIRIAAHGVEAAQLPELRLDIPGARVLALSPRLENGVDGGQIIGVREQEFQILPLGDGPLTAPAIELPWWNVGADSTAIARLPARTLAVSPAGRSAGAREAPALWLWIALTLPALAALAWLAPRLRRSAWRLRLACRAGNPATARDAALNWGARRWPTAPPRSLPELAARLPAGELAAMLLALDARLYGPETGRR